MLLRAQNKGFRIFIYFVNFVGKLEMVGKQKKSAPRRSRAVVMTMSCDRVKTPMSCEISV